MRVPTGAHSSDVIGGKNDVNNDITGKGFHNMSQTTVQMSLGKQKIIEDIKVLLNDSEELVRLSASLPAEGVDALRTRLRDHVDAARNALETAQSSAQERYRASLEGTVQYTRDNPWQALGIAAGIGFLAGILVSR
jgi:ElaB/YqjD/DUF883 family membrane-anchored ribosome-binding protein